MMTRREWKQYKLTNIVEILRAEHIVLDSELDDYDKFCEKQ